jgi:hypothetical protein
MLLLVLLLLLLVWLVVGLQVLQAAAWKWTQHRHQLLE